MQLARNRLQQLYNSLPYIIYHCNKNKEYLIPQRPISNPSKVLQDIGQDLTKNNLLRVSQNLVLPRQRKMQNQQSGLDKELQEATVDRNCKVEIAEYDNNYLYPIRKTLKVRPENIYLSEHIKGRNFSNQQRKALFASTYTRFNSLSQEQKDKYLAKAKMTRERLAKQKLEFDQLYLLPKISESCPNIGFMEFIRNFGDGTALKKKLLVEQYKKFSKEEKLSWKKKAQEKNEAGRGKLREFLGRMGLTEADFLWIKQVCTEWKATMRKKRKMKAKRPQHTGSKRQQHQRTRPTIL